MRIGLAALVVLAASPALAVGPTDALEAAVTRLDAAERSVAAARSSAVPVADYAGSIPELQAALTALRTIVVEAEGRERAITSDLDERRDELMRLAVGLEALTRAGAAPSRLHPGGPMAAARASAMLEGMRPGIGARAAALAATLGDLATLRGIRAEGEVALADGADALGRAREDLSLALVAMQPPPGDDPAAAALLRGSDTLSALAAGLAQAGGAAETEEGDAGETEPTLGWPVAGTVALHFNEQDAGGVHRPGLTLAAAPLSLVTAPAKATVRYAGPFLDYGYVVVVEPEPATLVVLAGLAQLNVAAGTVVERGALLGLLGGRALSSEEYVMPQTSTGAAGSETLYIEIRHGKGPVDPEPWFSGDNG